MYKLEEPSSSSSPATTTSIGSATNGSASAKVYSGKFQQSKKMQIESSDNINHQAADEAINSTTTHLSKSELSSKSKKLQKKLSKNAIDDVEEEMGDANKKRTSHKKNRKQHGNKSKSLKHRQNEHKKSNKKRKHSSKSNGKHRANSEEDMNSSENESSNHEADSDGGEANQSDLSLSSSGSDAESAHSRSSSLVRSASMSRSSSSDSSAESSSDECSSSSSSSSVSELLSESGDDDDFDHDDDDNEEGVVNSSSNSSSSSIESDAEYSFNPNKSHAGAKAGLATNDLEDGEISDNPSSAAHASNELRIKQQQEEKLKQQKKQALKMKISKMKKKCSQLDLKLKKMNKFLKSMKQSEKQAATSGNESSNPNSREQKKLNKLKSNKRGLEKKALKYKKRLNSLIKQKKNLNELSMTQDHKSKSKRHEKRDKHDRADRHIHQLKRHKRSKRSSDDLNQEHSPSSRNSLHQQQQLQSSSIAAGLAKLPYPVLNDKRDMNTILSILKEKQRNLNEMLEQTEQKLNDLSSDDEAESDQQQQGVESTSTKRARLRNLNENIKKQLLRLNRQIDYIKMSLRISKLKRMLADVESSGANNASSQDVLNWRKELDDMSRQVEHLLNLMRDANKNFLKQQQDFQHQQSSKQSNHPSVDTKNDHSSEHPTGLQTSSSNPQMPPISYFRNVPPPMLNGPPPHLTPPVGVHHQQQKPQFGIHPSPSPSQPQVYKRPANIRTPPLPPPTAAAANVAPTHQPAQQSTVPFHLTNQDPKAIAAMLNEKYGKKSTTTPSTNNQTINASSTQPIQQSQFNIGKGAFPSAVSSNRPPSPKMRNPRHTPSPPSQTHSSSLSRTSPSSTAISQRGLLPQPSPNQSQSQPQTPFNANFALPPGLTPAMLSNMMNNPQFMQSMASMFATTMQQHGINPSQMNAMLTQMMNTMAASNTSQTYTNESSMPNSSRNRYGGIDNRMDNEALLPTPQMNPVGFPQNSSAPQMNSMFQKMFQNYMSTYSQQQPQSNINPPNFNQQRASSGLATGPSPSKFYLSSFI